MVVPALSYISMTVAFRESSIITMLCFPSVISAGKWDITKENDVCVTDTHSKLVKRVNKLLTSSHPTKGG